MPRYRQGADVVQAPREVAKAPVAKMSYVKSQRTMEGMNDAQKEGVRLWNQMRQLLIDNGLMETK